MKKSGSLFITLIFALIIFAGCSTKATNTNANAYGNTNGNIINGGLAVQKGDIFLFL